MGAGEHKDKELENIGFAVITVSDTRTEEDDLSGQAIMKSAESAGHTVELYRIVKDDAGEIKQAFEDAVGSENVNALVFTGGTGIAARDSTPDILMPFFDRELIGFGELFRSLSYREIGTASIISRATAGTAGRKIVYCIPGSRGAVKLAMESIILKETGHILWELDR